MQVRHTLVPLQPGLLPVVDACAALCRTVHLLSHLLIWIFLKPPKKINPICHTSDALGDTGSVQLLNAVYFIVVDAHAT